MPKTVESIPEARVPGAASPRVGLGCFRLATRALALATLFSPAALAAVPQWFSTLATPAVGSGPYGTAIGDLDGDAFPDLVSVNRGSDNISVVHNNGNGTFAARVNYATGSGPQGVVIGDFNADGRADLAIANNNATTISILLNNGDGTFAPKVDYAGGSSPYALAIGDLDADGKPDIAVASSNSFSVSVLRGNGNGTFAAKVDFTVGNGPWSVAIRDIDVDGKLDLAVLNAGASTVSLLRNTSTGPGNLAFGTRTDVPTGPAPYSVSVDDLNADGKPDLVVPSATGNNVGVLLSTSAGPGSFTFAARVDYPTGTGPRAAAIRDLDNDGSADIVSANYDANTVSVLRNLGNGTFATAENFATGVRPRGVALGDIDADGRAEIVAANNSATTLTVLKNKSFTIGHVRAGLTTGNNDGSSWTNAYRDLRTALTDLQSAPWVRELWVATGTYTPAPPNGPRTASFNLRSNLSLYGGFAGNETSLAQRDIAQNPTVLSGDLNTNDAGAPFPLNRADNAYNVVQGDAIDASSVLDGFTISGGFADTPPFQTESSSGGGLLLVGGAGASPIVRNCVFTANAALSGGGAFVGTNAVPKFVNCDFIGNSAALATTAGLPRGGAIAFIGGHGELRNCRFTGNLATNYGGAVFIGNNGGPVGILSSTFTRNAVGGDGVGGAVCAETSGRVSLINSRFEGNLAYTGAAIGNLSGAPTDLINCAVVGNKVQGIGSAAAVHFGSNSGATIALRISNCSIISNDSAGPSGGTAGVAQGGGYQINFENSILWGNSTQGFTNESSQVGTPPFPGAHPAFSCTIQGLGQGIRVTPDAQCNATPPQFVRDPSKVNSTWGDADDDYGNLRLSQSSPMLDAGADARVPTDTFDVDANGDTQQSIPWDLDGSPRIQDNALPTGPRVDRGCYEGYRCPTCPQDRQWFSAIPGTWSDDPRWSFSAPTSCFYAVLEAAGLPYTIQFNDADAARGLLHSRGNVTLAGSSPTATLALRPPGVGVSCPAGVQQTFRPALRVSGAILDNPTLNITSGVVSASSGVFADLPGEIGSINVAGTGTRLTFASGTCSVGEQGDGTLNITDGATVAAGFFFVGQSDIDSQPDGVFDLHGSITVDGPASTLKPRFTLNITHGTVSVRNQGTIDCGTTGTVFVLPGSSLTGDGTVIGRVVNFGEVEPGDAGTSTEVGAFTPRTLTVSAAVGATGNAYEQIGNDPKTGSASGTLRLRAATNNGSVQSDSLTVNGTANLAGTLVLQPQGTFEPGANPGALPLLSATAFHNHSRFDLAVFPGLSNNRFLRLDYPPAALRGGSISVSVQPLSSNIDLDPTPNANIGGVPTGIVAAKLNADEFVDLALTVPDASNPTTAPGQVVILLNAGNSGNNWQGFQVASQLSVNVGINPRGLAAARINADSTIDLAVANAGSNTVTLLSNNGSGLMTATQTIGVGTAPVAVTTDVPRGGTNVATFIATANSGSNSVTILNNATGTLSLAGTLAAGDSPSDICAARLDAGSTTTDLAVTNRGDNTVTVYYRPPSGGFNSLPSRVLPAGNQPVKITPGTIDTPGGLDNPKDINDLAVTNFGGDSTSIFLNNNASGAGAGFLPKADLPTGTQPGSITPGDLDNDGDLDLSVVTTVGSERGVRVFRNDLQDLGNGEYQATFALFGDQYQGTQPLLVVSSDVNQDGRDDLIAVNSQTVTLRPAPRGVDAWPDAPERMITPQPNIATSLNTPNLVPPACPADLVPAPLGDGAVNTADLVAFLGQFGKTCQQVTGRCADFNSDSAINTADLVYFLGRFGAPCQ